MWPLESPQTTREWDQLLELALDLVKLQVYLAQNKKPLPLGQP